MGVSKQLAHQREACASPSPCRADAAQPTTSNQAMRRLKNQGVWSCLHLHACIEATMHETTDMQTASLHGTALHCTVQMGS
jgi:hypothetical protein